jgi:hypothetical protein
MRKGNCDLTASWRAGTRLCAWSPTTELPGHGGVTRRLASRSWAADRPDHRARESRRAEGGADDSLKMEPSGVGRSAPALWTDLFSWLLSGGASRRRTRRRPHRRRCAICSLQRSVGAAAKEETARVVRPPPRSAVGHPDALQTVTRSLLTRLRARTPREATGGAGAVALPGAPRVRARAPCSFAREAMRRPRAPSLVGGQTARYGNRAWIAESLSAVPRSHTVSLVMVAGLPYRPRRPADAADQGDRYRRVLRSRRCGDLAMIASSTRTPHRWCGLQWQWITHPCWSARSPRRERGLLRRSWRRPTVGP